MNIQEALREFGATATEDQLRELVRRLALVEPSAVTDGRETRWVLELDDVRAALGRG